MRALTGPCGRTGIAALRAEPAGRGRLALVMTVIGMLACGGDRGSRTSGPSAGSTGPQAATDRPYLLERVEDAAVVQLYADGFHELSARDKMLVWHLYRAALAGRDIFYDQRYAHSLEMRDVLEAVLTHPSGVDSMTLSELQRYTKLFWINSGPYNNLTARKFVLRCTPEALLAAARAAQKAGARFPLKEGETLDGLFELWISLSVRKFSHSGFEDQVTGLTRTICPR